MMPLPLGTDMAEIMRHVKARHVVLMALTVLLALGIYLGIRLGPIHGISPAPISQIATGDQMESIRNSSTTSVDPFPVIDKIVTYCGITQADPDSTDPNVIIIYHTSVGDLTIVDMPVQLHYKRGTQLHVRYRRITYGYISGPSSTIQALEEYPVATPLPAQPHACK